MINKATLVGRLTKDPELKQTTNNVSVCTFTVAVDRRFKNAAGEREADFINIVTWRQAAELVAKYFNKGSRIGLVGSIQTRSWDDQDGKRRYVTEVIADEIYFVDSAKDRSNGDGQQTGAFLPTGDDSTELPFDF